MPPRHHDLASHEPWLESKRRSRARRAAARRRRAMRLRRNGVSYTLAALMTLTAGAALAHEQAAPRHARAAALTAPLKHGAEGPAVAALQRALGITADGAFGPATERAVRRFQRRHGLEADGIVGRATAAALGLRVRRASSGALGEQESSDRRVAPNGALERIARCESGGDPAAVSRDGRYRGKYQFDRATWRAMGGKGDPAKSSEAEQDRRAARLMRLRGTAPWGACA